MPYQLAHHKVQDFAKWKHVFDEHEPARKAHGSKSTRVFRNADANEVIVLVEWESREGLDNFAQSQAGEMSQIQAHAGVIDQPNAYLLDEVEVNY